MARVSVVVPTFNRVGYLAETIASILAQDFRDFELVVADNASTDATAELIATIGDPRLVYVRRAHHVGWKANFNQALDATRSEYVTLVADDDRLLPGALTRAVCFLDAAPSVGFVHTTFHDIDDRGDTVRTDGNWSGRPATDRIERGADFIADAMRSTTPVCLSSTVMRAAALPEVCFEAADDVCGDLVLCLRIALGWDVGFLAAPGAQLRGHTGQLSSTFDEVDRFRALRASKLRFLAENSSRLDHVPSLRRDARHFSAAGLNRLPSIASSESREAGMRALRRVVRIRPQAVLSPQVWRAAVKIAVGPNVVRSLRRLRPGT